MTAEGISRKMVAARNANITIQASTDRRDVLPGVLLAKPENTGGRFFLWVHYYDPHANYAPPSPYREKFASAI